MGDTASEPCRRCFDLLAANLDPRNSNAQATVVEARKMSTEGGGGEEEDAMVVWRSWL